MKFQNNEQLAIELKKLMMDNRTSQKEISDRLKIKPQALTKILNKKNLSFEDVTKILEVMNYEMNIEFIKKEPTPK